LQKPTAEKIDFLPQKIGSPSCLEQGVNGLHMVQLMPLPPIISCFTKLQNGSAFLVTAYPGCPRKNAVKTDIVAVELCVKQQCDCGTVIYNNNPIYNMPVP